MSAANATEPILLTPRGGPEALFGLGHMRVDGDVAKVSMATGSWGRHSDGMPAAGALGVLLDDVLGQAVVMFRPAGQWSVTTELSIDFCAPVPVDGASVHAEARAVSIDAGGGLARGRAFDDSGRTVAVATTWARFVPGVPAAVRSSVAPSIDVESHVRSVAELIRARPDEGPAGGALVIPVGWAGVTNPAGAMHGGVLACALELGGTLELAADSLPASSLRVAYLRPAVGDIRVTAEVQHRGRALAVVRAVASGPAGKPCAVAILTYRSAAAPA